MIRLLFVILLLSLASNLFAQGDSQLAFRYYENKDYGKAAEIFMQLYERTRSSQYLDYHIVSLINNKDYDKAEETMKRFLKTSDNREFFINLGYIYQQQGKSQKMEEYFNKALRTLLPNNNDINNLAYKFRNIREYEWANKTYFKGHELLKNPTAFLLEIGDNAMYSRNFDTMLDHYFEYLKMKPGEISQITSKLNSAQYSDVNNSIDTVIWTHLNKIFQTPDYAPAFDEVAVWVATQTEMLQKAFEYAIKLNSKMEGKYYTYTNIAREARRKKEYKLAIDAYTKVLEAGKENNNEYNTARRDILFCRYDEYVQQSVADSLYMPLAKSCEEYLKESGFSDPNTDLILILSDMYAYKLNMPDSAGRILENGSNIRRLSLVNMNRLKSKRADILAYHDNPWEATILYTQIEKSNPNNDVGFEAKLKKAWMAYYEGDLLWANAQFAVLKGSTTKVIANDALKMSHFIGMNYDPEGDNADLGKVARAEYFIYKEDVRKASQTLDSLINNTALPGISDYAKLLKVRVLVKQNATVPAISILKELQQNSEDIYIRAEAIYTLAGLEQEARNRNEAMALYKELITDYSGSVYSVEAARQYRLLEQ